MIGLVLLFIFLGAVFVFGICAYVTSVWLVRKMNEEKVEEIVSEMDLLDITHFPLSVV